METIFNSSQKDQRLVVAISNRQDGSMIKKRELILDNLIPFLDRKNIPFKNTHFMKQVHSGNVAVVNSNTEQIIENVDGIISRDKDIFLGVATADCLPVLFYDYQENIVGSAHAGFKGLLNGIIENMISNFKLLGSNTKNMTVYIGPSINSCCYSIDSDRARSFVEKFGNEDTIIKYKGDIIYLDLQEVCKLALESCGVLTQNILVSEDCTSCDVHKYFSYRKDSTETFGEQVSVIGVQTI